MKALRAIVAALTLGSMMLAVTPSTADAQVGARGRAAVRSPYVRGGARFGASPRYYRGYRGSPGPRYYRGYRDYRDYRGYRDPWRRGYSRYGRGRGYYPRPGIQAGPFRLYW